MRAVAVTVLASLAFVGGASAAFPGSNGKLVYFARAEIWTVNADGTAERSLGAGLSPSWSPSGRLLVFDTIVDRNDDVWIMRADGSNRRRVTRDPAPDYFASWSPEGTSLVFTSDRGGEDLYVIEADGTGERRLTTDSAPEWGPAWSPDGTRIAFAGNARGNLEVEVVNADGSGRIALTDHPARDFDPAWSPDGTRIAFTSERDGNANIYVMNADGSGAQALTTDPSDDLRPAWSPDGTMIAFESNRDPAIFDRDVYLMNADGSDQRRMRAGDRNARDVDWQPTVDLALTARGRRATVTNRSAIAESQVVLRVSSGRRARTQRVGTIAANSARSVRLASPPRAQRVSVTVTGWHADPNPRNNRVTLRIRR